MKRRNRLLAVISILTLCLTGGNILMLSDMKTAIETGSVIQDWMSSAVAVFLIVIGLAHILAILILWKQFWQYKNDSLLRAAAFVIGFFSLFLLAADVMMLSDIGHEYPFGYDISGEWRIVFAGHFVHALFAALLLFQCAATSRMRLKNSQTATAVKDEALFLAVNQIGILSAILGLVCLLLTGWSGVPQQYRNGLLFLLCFTFLIPYGLAAGCWLFSKRKEKPVNWYDEKQVSDVSRGALFTLLITVFLTLIVYLLSSFQIIFVSTAIWFPEYLLLTLLLFSGRTLYLSKRV